MSTTTLRALSQSEIAPRYEITTNESWGTYHPSALQRLLILIARNSFLHRGKFRHRITNLIAKLQSPIDVEFRNCRYRIDGKNNLAEYGLLLNPLFNQPEIDFLIDGLPQGGVAVDIGSNIGLYSLPMALKCGPKGRVVAIDANPGMMDRLAENARLSGLPQIKPVCAAVGDHDGKVDLFIRKDDVAIVNVKESDQGLIPMRKLMSIIEEEHIDRIDVLKIDIEGYEDAALVPFFAMASEALMPNRIVIERGGPDGSYQGCRKAFLKNGYQLIGNTRCNQMFMRA